ncbi:DUF4034 domain-containing protein [Solimonas sp. K1W22B-7]|uniref:DUF4034 domain-containing protein n=1 Tax=Solimonas sp. K1W22B-7 TaxID=2303331 RepID=UPI000E335D0D|nr:DUF4034 domain-containing protein [Solimonas sp. K1W22B-7]AXQ29879.1 DUF4034 domain-containing protein [Solimonas sp. K1W22B-7]
MPSRLLATLLLLLATPMAWALPELEERETIREEVGAHYFGRDFAALSGLAARYRKGERTESGLWKLSLFYVGIEQVAQDTRGKEIPWRATLKTAADWATARPDDPTPRVVQAKLMIARAWQFRGGDWASRVPQQNMDAFHAELRRAEAHLLQYKAMASQDPEWYRCMLGVANGLSWDRERFAGLVDEATQKHPYYYEIYFAALEYLTPRWHGSDRQIDDFVAFAVSRTQPVEGGGLYARIYWFASQIEYGDRLAKDSLLDWRRMKGGIADVLKRYPDQWNINNFGRFACLAGDRATTRELLMKMEAPVLLEGWGDIGMSGYADCLRWSIGKAEYPDYLKPPAAKPPPKRKPSSSRNAA